MSSDQKQFVAVGKDGKIVWHCKRGVISDVTSSDDGSYSVTVTEVHEDGTPLTWLEKLADARYRYGPSTA